MADFPAAPGGGDCAGVTWVRLQAGLNRESVQLVDDTTPSIDKSPTSDVLMTSLREAAYNFIAKKFADRLFDGIRECLLMFTHDVSNPNVLQLLTSSSQLSDGILVEVVLSSMVTMDDNNCSRPHSLAVHNYKSPHFCDLCGEMLWGLFKQGLKCDGCGLNFHKRCVYKIINNCGRNRKQSLTPDDSTVTPSPAVQSPALTPSMGSVRCVAASNGAHVRSSVIPASNSGSRESLASSSAGTLSRQIQVPHTFVVHNVTMPTVCQFCHKLLALFRQSLQCKDCQFYCHKKCVEYVPKNCQGETRLQQPVETDEPQSLDDSTENDEQYAMSQIREADEDKPDDDEVDDVRQSNFSANIPLMRVVQSVKHTKRAGANIIREGWMVHYTNRDKTRRLHYWKLDTKSITMFTSKESTRYYKEIQLADIVKLEQAVLPAASQRSHYIFELHTVETIYYTGEDCEPNLNADDKGLGRQLGQWMETAIRQALLPVTPKASGEDQPTTAVKVTVDVEEKKDINQLYQVFPEDILGSGQFGVVYGAMHKVDGHEVAVKVIDKLRFPNKQEAVLKNEVAILKNLHHPGVVNLEDMFETPAKIFVVMEKLRGDMLEMILSSPKGRLNERVTRYLISQVLKALQYLHAKPRSIVHCDLKPENVLLSTGGSFPQVKLCDFGFARIIGEKSFRRSLVGTPAYLAPEVLKNKCYNRSLDMWSVGVIMYVSLSGTFPFNENEDISDQIHNAAFMYPPNPWKEVSRDAINLIGKLLQVKLGNRYTADQSLDHHWLQDYKCWCDLRKLESQVGERYLTYETEDERWVKYQTDNQWPHWTELGHQLHL